MPEIKFNNYYGKANIISLVLIIISLLLLTLKGLNFGVDFKGGTLIEIRSNDNNLKISDIRDNFKQLNLSGVTVKQFGNDTDYIVKFQSNQSSNSDFIKNIKKKINSNLNNKIDFRRIENVGPKVSSELLRSGIIAIGL